MDGGLNYLHAKFKYNAEACADMPDINKGFVLDPVTGALVLLFSNFGLSLSIPPWSVLRQTQSKIRKKIEKNSYDRPNPKFEKGVLLITLQSLDCPCVLIMCLVMLGE